MSTELEKLPICRYCAFEMRLIFNERTPAGMMMTAYMCPNCFAPNLLGHDGDIVFEFIKTLVAAERKFYEENIKETTKE